MTKERHLAGRHTMTANRSARIAAIVAAVALTACSHAVTTQADAAAGIDSGAALNSEHGVYRVSDVDVTLEKVVSLPGDELGLRFSFASEPPGCCSIFPRIALASDPDAAPGAPSDVVIPTAAIGDDGTVAARLSDGRHATAGFTIDLRALGVPTS
jgi:hypothetical protein